MLTIIAIYTLIIFGLSCVLNAFDEYKSVGQWMVNCIFIYIPVITLALSVLGVI